MRTFEFRKGLQEVGSGVYAYLQPDGTWGLSNAGLVVGGNRSLLIDTLFDLTLTGEMLEAMREAVPASESVDQLVITHPNGDHYNGCQLLPEAEIIATGTCAREMAEMPPRRLAEMMSNAGKMGPAGKYLEHCFGKFHFDNIMAVRPTRTFEKRLDIKVGEREVRLIDVGPAHTKSDLVVHIPDASVIFTGDILFIGGTPIMWAGPVANWINGCDLLLQSGAEVFVPGHGPITGRSGVEAIKGYMEYVRDEAAKRYEAGLTEDEAVADIRLKDYAVWTDSERIVANVATLYREFRGDTTSPNPQEVFAKMAAYWLKRNGG